MRFIASASIATCVSLIAMGAVWAQDTSSTVPTVSIRPRGPLPVRDYEPINSLFLLPVPTDASVLARKAQRLDVNLDAPNDFLILPQINYYTDLEDHRYTLAYSRGLGDGQQIDIRVPYIERGGGIFDGLINGWHKTFGMFGGGRGNFSNNQMVLRIPDAQSGKYIVDSTSSESGLGDITLEYRRALSAGEPGFDADGKADPRRVTLTGRALLKLPTGSSSKLLGSGATDFGLGLIASARPWRRIAFHGNLTVVWNGKAENDALKNRSTSVQSLGAIEWMIDGRTSFLTQIDDAPAPNRTGVDYADRNRRMFTFGFWRQITPRQSAYISLGENDFGRAAEMAPDLSLSAGTRFTL